MARKAVPQSQRAKNAGISFTPSFQKSARKLASAKNKSLTAYVRDLLTDKLVEAGMMNKEAVSK